MTRNFCARVFYSLAFVYWGFVGKVRLDIMKKIDVFYTVLLGIFWEAVYVLVIIGIGLLVSLTI